MKEFKDYQFASIDEPKNETIKSLETQLKSETGKDIVLIAYEEKSSERA